MAKWLLLRDAAAMTGYSVSGLANVIHSGAIPPECVRIVEFGHKHYEVRSDAIAAIIDHKRNWHAAQAAPAGTQYVADPSGEHLGFELTPEEAVRLATIRAYHRLYPDVGERNRAMRGSNG